MLVGEKIDGILSKLSQVGNVAPVVVFVDRSLPGEIQTRTTRSAAAVLQASVNNLKEELLGHPFTERLVSLRCHDSNGDSHAGDAV